MTFNLKARINRSDARTTGRLSTNSPPRVPSANKAMSSSSKPRWREPKELNRMLLSALKKVGKRTTLRAEWTSGDTTRRYFDYVLKKTIKV